MNSGIIAVAVVASSMLFNTMAAYFFARLPFPGKKWLTAYVLATFLLPFEVTVVPLYLVVSDLGLRNTYWAMIVPFYASPFIVFLLSQFLGEHPEGPGRGGAGGRRELLADPLEGDLPERAAGHRDGRADRVPVHLEPVLLAADRHQLAGSRR